MDKEDLLKVSDFNLQVENVNIQYSEELNEDLSRVVSYFMKKKPIQMMNDYTSDGKEFFINISVEVNYVEYEHVIDILNKGKYTLFAERKENSSDIELSVKCVNSGWDMAYLCDSKFEHFIIKDVSVPTNPDIQTKIKKLIYFVNEAKISLFRDYVYNQETKSFETCFLGFAPTDDLKTEIINEIIDGDTYKISTIENDNRLEILLDNPFEDDEFED